MIDPATFRSPAARESAQGTEELRIALVDPSLFTIPYDAKLAGALGDLGHEVTVYGEARSSEEEPTEFARLRPLFYSELSRRHRSWPRPVQRLAKGALHWRAMRRLVEEFRVTKPDVIHFQWTPLPAVDRLFLRALRSVAPIVLTAHDSRPFNGAAWQLQKWGATRILSDFDGVIVHTGEARERLADYGVPPDRLVRIPHGLLHDIGPATVPLAGPPVARSSGTVRFLLFGKLKFYKGADLLIEAFRRLPADLQQRVEVHIVGKPYMDVARLTAAAEQVGEGIRLDFRFVPDAEMNELLARTDVIVFPYREIDVSGVLMAALRHGRPIIASRIGGFAELLVDGRHGLLVPADNAAALAEAMARLCAEPGTRSAMGKATAALGAEIPSWEEIARRTVELYRAVRRPDQNQRSGT
jgi:glycosyltransferase involved in cell wall biosynthesis